MPRSTRARVSLLALGAAGLAAGLIAGTSLDLPGSLAASEASSRSAPRDSTQVARRNPPTATAPALSEDFAAVAEKVTPAVVTVRVRRRVEQRRQLPSPFPFPVPPGAVPEGEGQQPPMREGAGSGFIIRPSGYIVTNSHVVADAEEITVELANQKQFRDVKVVGQDRTTDIALLKVDGEDLPTVALGSSDSTEVGEMVLAVGSPGVGGGSSGVLPATVTAGIVSGKHRSLGLLGRRFEGNSNPAIEDFIQTDAAINPGNSGGPLVNMSGEVIGVNTAIASETGYYIGYGFAVPIELAGEVVSDLIRHGEVRRAALGIGVQPVTARDAEYYGLDRVGGAKVVTFNEVQDGTASPAREAGIEQGDVIVELGGRSVNSVSDLQRLVHSHDPGTTVDVTVVRRSSRERETVEVTLGRMGTPGQPESEQTAASDAGGTLGLKVQGLEPAIRARLEVPEEVQGVVVTAVARGGPAARAGIRPRSVIQDVNGEPIENRESFREIVDSLEPGSVANMQVYVPGMGASRFVSVRVPGS